MNYVEGQIERQGYATVPFGMSEADRANFTLLANDVITLALGHPRLAEALAYDAAEDRPDLQQTTFGLSGANDSKDEKYTLHLGYQSETRAEAQIPKRNQPAALRELWVMLPDVWAAIESTARDTLEALEEPGLSELIFHPDVMERNLVLRCARYMGACAKPVGTEVFNAHLDMNILTQHPFASPDGWFQMVPVPPDLVADDNGPERQRAFRSLREGLRPITFDRETEVATFLGASYPQVTDRVRPLPVGYHGGFRCSPEDEIVSIHVPEDAVGEDDRVAWVNFLHPSLPYLRESDFITPTVAMCRPSWWETE